MQSIETLLQSLDSTVPVAQRHLQLISLLSWIRGDAKSTQAPAKRVEKLLDVLETHSELRLHFKSYWSVLAQTVDITTLLADLGFAPRMAFLSELMHRISRKLLPATPETSDASELFELAFNKGSDASWIVALDEATLQRLYKLLDLPSPEDSLSLWQHELLDAFTYCAGQVRSIGFAPEIRLRMNTPAAQTRPFHALAADAENFRSAYAKQPYDAESVAVCAQQLRDRLELCRQVTAGVYSHLEMHGVSVGLVFTLREMRKRIVRIRELMDCLLSTAPLASSQRLIARLAILSLDQQSVAALMADNSSMLASKVAERSAETGEHYITRDSNAYRMMLGKAAGGGALMSLTTLVKFALAGLSVSVFWAGFFASINYAVTFIAIALLHFTVATKQPAMTAPAMAAKLKDIELPGVLNEFVDEVTHLVRSQVAAVIGNLALVVPCVMGINAVIYFISGAHMVDRDEAMHVLQSLSLLGPMALFAAFTGLLLFASSIAAGWTENWFVLYRLDSAIQYNPRITGFLGAARAARWSQFWRKNISSFASSVSLGLMLGLIPAFATFFGLGLEVRHVTLSTGQLSAAAASLGMDVFRTEGFWWSVAAIPVMGFLNIGVSFYCAFRVALTAHNVSHIDRARIRSAIGQRFKTAPLSYFLPVRQALVAQAQ